MSITTGNNVIIKDTLGKTKACSSSVTTTAVAVPATSEGIISEMYIRVSGAEDVQVSFDDEASYFTIASGTEFQWHTKGNIEEVHFKTAANTSTVDLLINFEDS